jgi:hypothetical protein
VEVFYTSLNYRAFEKAFLNLYNFFEKKYFIKIIIKNKKIKKKFSKKRVSE